MPGHFPVILRVRKSNRDRLLLVDLARRQADHLGPDGIRAKRRQTNDEFLRRGRLRLRFRTRAQAMGFQRRVQALGEPAIRTTRMRNPNPL